MSTQDKAQLRQHWQSICRFHRFEKKPNRTNQLFQLAVIRFHDVVEVFGLSVFRTLRALTFAFQFRKSDRIGYGFLGKALKSINS